MGKILSEVRKEAKVKLNLMGDPGVGKTCAALSFPTPLLMFDFDGKADSAAVFYKNDNERLSGITVEDMSASLTNDPITTMNKIIDTVLIPQQRTGKMAIETLVIDPITMFSRGVLNHIIKTNPGIKRVTSAQGVQPGLVDYGILRREFSKLIPGLLSLPCHVVFTSHLSVSKDDITGEIIRGPVMDGSFASELNAYFKEAWVLTVDKGRRIAQTQSDFKYKCRSQIYGLPEKFDFTDGFKALEKYL